MLCYVPEGSPSEDATQPKHPEAAMVIGGSTKAKTRTEHGDPSTVLDTKKELIRLDLLTVQEM